MSGIMLILFLLFDILIIGLGMCLGEARKMKANSTNMSSVEQRTRIEHRLERLRYMKQDHNDLVMEYNHLFPSCVSRLSHLPFSKSDSYQPETWAAKREKLKKRIKAIHDDITDEENRIYNTLLLLPAKHRKILIMHYLKDVPIKRIADELNVQPEYVNKLKRQAIATANRSA